MDTAREQEVLQSVLSSPTNPDLDAQKAELRKIRQRRKMTATYKAHKALETLHAEQYERLFAQAYEVLGTDSRYSETV